MRKSIEQRFVINFGMTCGDNNFITNSWKKLNKQTFFPHDD